jgi:hypothetical protein
VETLQKQQVWSSGWPTILDEPCAHVVARSGSHLGDAHSFRRRSTIAGRLGEHSQAHT